MNETHINKLANRALENLYGGWLALAEAQLIKIIEATGEEDDGVRHARVAASHAAADEADGSVG